MTKRGRKLHQNMQRRLWVKLGSPRTIIAFDYAKKAGEFTARLTADIIGDRVWITNLQYWEYQEPRIGVEALFNPPIR